VKLKRREFIATFVLGLLVPRWRASAQVSTKTPRVGYLGSQNTRTRTAFLEGLQALGYVPGQNFLLEFRAPERPDKYEQFPALAAQFVAAGVDVILAATPSAIEATTRATRTIPIVGVDLESDPVAKGWAATLAHPGGNFTGFVLDIPEMSGKQLQFRKELKPDLSRVAVLGDPRMNELQSRAAEAAAREPASRSRRSPSEMSGLGSAGTVASWRRWSLLRSVSVVAGVYAGSVFFLEDDD
jgi:putative tryptophan/tyrosine transport system substrate-binding protein